MKYWQCSKIPSQSLNESSRLKCVSRSIATIDSLSLSIVRSRQSEESVSNDVQSSSTFTESLKSNGENLEMVVVLDGTVEN